MKSNPLIQLEKLGQAVWLDFIDRKLIASGELRRLIEVDGLSGITSNRYKILIYYCLKAK